MIDAGRVADKEWMASDSEANGLAVIYAAMLKAAPKPPHLSMTKAEAAVFQDWKGMDGACAFHLIERHANGWGDTARMMGAWLAANAALCGGTSATNV